MTQDNTLSSEMAVDADYHMAVRLEDECPWETCTKLMIDRLTTEDTMNTYKFRPQPPYQQKREQESYYEAGENIQKAAETLCARFTYLKGVTLGAWFVDGEGYTMHSEIQKGAFIGFAKA